MDKILQDEQEILKTVRENLKLLMSKHGLTVSNFCDYIQEQEETSLDRTTFTRFMAGTIHKINLAFLVSCSRAFNLSLDNLVSTKFNPYENFQSVEEKYKDILKKEGAHRTFNYDYSANEVFIENPESSLLDKYMQPYYCYYYSTVAAENNTGDIREALISGQLIIEPNGKRCKATLKIDTKMLDEDGNTRYKIYNGDVILCPSIQSFHCILTLPEGEFCFIIFRYSHLNYNMQECRLAEVLSTSSTPDKRYPIVHRMLLSNEKIKEEDLVSIAPHLCFNSTEILINEAGLLDLAGEMDEYSLVVQEFLKNDPELMYSIKESTAKEIFKKYLPLEEFPVFITKLRSYSFTKRYNKVSMAADELIRNVLLQKGYFQKNIAR